MGAAAIAAAMVMSTVPATPVQAAGGKTLAVFSQKQLNQALKTVKGKNAVITVKEIVVNSKGTVAIKNNGIDFP